jgi:hypothetical protein
VICPDQEYHMLLHARMRIQEMGGNPNTQWFCGTCKRMKLLEEMTRRFGKPYPRCKQCNRVLASYYYHAKKTRPSIHGDVVICNDGDFA